MTLYGNTLAWESSPAQTMRHQPMRLLAQPSYTGAYDIDQDPLWTHTPQALPIDVLAWYQCDHLGTPQELTDPTGQIAWSAQYNAWGEVKEQRSEWAQRQGLTNPIRFQGQYHDHETGLHYNRYRYYDPRAGRFVSKDPISYAGGLNLYAYAPNPVEWVDPLGLWKGQPRKPNGTFGPGANPARRCPDAPDPTKKVHGNDLDSDAPAIGYTLRDQETNEVMKYGETTRGKKRYSDSYMDENKLDFTQEASGSKREMHTWQHERILEYKERNGGKRPPLNKSDY